MDYAGLVAAIQNWGARSDAVIVSEIPNFVSFATDMFNNGMPERSIAPLRVREMITTDDLTMTDGVGALPSDYLQYITAQSMASTPRALTYAPGSYSNVAYDNSAGLSNIFSIVGSSVNVFPLSGSDLRLVYYAKIPNLTDSVTTNWLIEKMPALYLHASLLQLALFTMNDALLAREVALVASMVDGLNLTDTLSTYAKTGSRMGMLTP